MAASLSVIVATVQFADRYVCVCIYTRNKREEKRESRLYSFASLIGYPRIKTQPAGGGISIIIFVRSYT